jgi:hypothetical protein
LGAGTVTASWKWYYFQDNVYEKIGDRIKEYSQQERRLSRRKRYTEKGFILMIPQQAQLCTVERDGIRMICTGVIEPEEKEEGNENHTSFNSFITNKLKTARNPEQYIWMLEDNETPSEHNLQLLKESLEANELIGCTDASTKDGVSTAFFKFQTKAGATVLQGEVLVPGEDQIQCSHRGEMGGAAAALSWLQLIIEYKKIKNGTVHLGCDSDNVVSIGLQQDSESNSVADHYDLVRACRRVRKEIHPIEVVAVKVEGHTDNLTRRKTTMEKNEYRM